MLEPCDGSAVTHVRPPTLCFGMHVCGKGEYVAKIGVSRKEIRKKWESKNRDKSLEIPTRNIYM